MALSIASVRVVTLAASVSLGSCVPYPVYKTLQPPAKVTVLDSAARPVSAAEVSLIANSYPYGFEKHREIGKTGPDGVVRFNATREWRIESLMIHGSESFFWNWCVRKDGYATYSTSHRTAKGFENNLVVRLKPGVSKACPKSL